jgi:hypothetical protein
MLFAVRTRVDAGALESTMIFASVDTAALDIWCSRAIDCEKAARFASQYALWKSASFIQLHSVGGATLAALAASSTFRWDRSATMAACCFRASFPPDPAIS